MYRTAHRRLTAAQLLSEVGVGQFIGVPAEDDLLHVLGQPVEAAGQQGDLLVADGLAAGRGAGIDQKFAQVIRSFLTAGIAFAGAEVLAQRPPGGPQHDGPQPRGQLGDSAALKAVKGLVSLDQGILDQVGVVQAAGQPAAADGPDQETNVGARAIQHLAAGLLVTAQRPP